MLPLPRAGNIQSYLRRLPSLVELDERIDTVYEEGLPSTGNDRGPSEGPGTGWDKNEILLEADEFVTRYDLDEIRDLVRKGALLYYDPDDLERVDDLTREELAALHDQTEEEKAVKVCKIRSLFAYVCYMAAAIYASLQHVGWGLFHDPYGSNEPVWLGTARWIGSALLGCILTVPLNRCLGRRKAICTAAVLGFVAAWASFAFKESKSMGALLAAYLLAGTAMGILGCTVPLYLSETSVASSRGFRIATWHMGILLWECITSAIGVSQKRAVNIALSITTISAFIIVCLTLAKKTPESPYWCVSNRKMRKAFESLRYLRKADIIAARDLCQIYFASVHSDTAQRGGSDSRVASTPRFAMPVTNPRLRRMVLASAGIILIRNVSAFQITQAHLYLMIPPSVGAAIASAVATFVLGFISAVATRLDKTGRRPVLLISTLLLFLLIQIPVIEFDSSDVAIFLFFTRLLYSVVYQIGEVIYMIYAAEVFPVQYNDMGMAIALATNHGSLVLVVFGISFIARFGYFPSRQQLSIPHFVSLLLIWLVVRETKQVSLENIGSIFDVPTRNLILYRVKVHLPYFFKRNILWRDVDLVALEDSRYRFAAIRLDDTGALPGSREEQPG